MFFYFPFLSTLCPSIHFCVLLHVSRQHAALVSLLHYSFLSHRHELIKLWLCVCVGEVPFSVRCACVLLALLYLHWAACCGLGLGFLLTHNHTHYRLPSSRFTFTALPLKTHQRTNNKHATRKCVNIAVSCMKWKKKDAWIFCLVLSKYSAKMSQKSVSISQ